MCDKINCKLSGNTNFIPISFISLSDKIFKIERYLF